MHLNKLDLNLLLALDALFEKCHVGRAAETMNVSQPTMSVMLGKLRRHFADDLLVRDGARLAMTPLAELLRPLISDFVAGARAIADANLSFDLKTSKRRFVVVIGPVGALLYVPGMLRKIRVEAPHVTLGCYEVAANTIRLFNDGKADLLIVPTSRWLQGGDQSWFGRHCSEALPEDRLVCIAWLGNGQVRDGMTFEDATKLSYVIPSFAATDFRPPAERPLAEVYGVELDVVAEAPLTSIPEQIVGTPLAAIVSHDFARFAARRADLKIVDLPDGFTRARPMRMFWTRRQAGDPAVGWLRKLLLEELDRFTATE